MHVTTSTHILTLTDHQYSLRKLGVAGDDSWLESRRGEAFDRHLRVHLRDTTIELFFENKSIGHIPLSQKDNVNEVIELVNYWNKEIGPTDLNTVKTVELLKSWGDLLTTMKFKLKVVTYNTAGLLGELALKRETWSKLFGQDIENYDIVVLSFQESDSLNRVKNSYMTLQRVCDLSKGYLFKSHTLLSSVQLLGLMTVVFVSKKLAPHVSHLSTSTSSTGFLRVWGNKGAVLTKFVVYGDEIIGNGHEFVFVNCHLSAGEGATQLGRRKWELREIGSKFGVPDLAAVQVNEDDTCSISDVSDESGDESNYQPPIPDDVEEDVTDLNARNADECVEVTRAGSRYIMLMGDLNYRVLLSENESMRKVQNKEWEGLLAHDSLLLERKQNLVFQGFEEANISFPPTFKYELGTHKLKGRVPSYTDRIMYRTQCKNTVLGYNSITECIDSDHRPVTFTGEVESDVCVSPDVKEQVIQRAMKISDTAENNARPKMDVDKQTVTLKGAPLSVIEQNFIVKNTGSRPLTFVIENAQTEADRITAEANDLNEDESAKEFPQKQDELVDLPPLKLSRRDSVAITPTSDVIITPSEGKISASSPVCEIKIEARVGLVSRDVILLIKPKPSENSIDVGVQKYVFVKIETTKSILGASINSLKMKDDIPVAVLELGEYLRKRPKIPLLFRTQAERTLFQQVLSWLDNDEKLDVEVLESANAAKPHAGDYAVAQVLLTLFYYLPEQILGPSLKRKQANSMLKLTITYLCRLLTEIVDCEDIEEVQTLDVWASALYDRNDKKAGIVEKRTYLRSMLIMSTQPAKTEDQIN